AKQNWRLFQTRHIFLRNQARWKKSHNLQVTGSLNTSATAADRIPSEVENGATGKPRHRREGRRLSEREVSESNPRVATLSCHRGVVRIRFCFAQDDARSYFRVSLNVATRPHKLFVPQIPARRHSNCTI